MSLLEWAVQKIADIKAPTAQEMQNRGVCRALISRSPSFCGACSRSGENLGKNTSWQRVKGLDGRVISLLVCDEGRLEPMSYYLAEVLRGSV